MLGWIARHLRRALKRSVDAKRFGQRKKTNSAPSNKTARAAQASSISSAAVIPDVRFQIAPCALRLVPGLFGCVPQGLIR
jgi:hypothetical protein